MNENPHHHHDADPGAQHFDERAATWDETPEHQERADAVVSVIRSQVRLSAQTSVLEFGAGTGLVAQGLANSVGQLTLVDTSTGMREVMAAKVNAGDLPASTRIWDLDLTAETGPEITERFDLVVAVMVLHHLGDVTAALAKLVALLTPGGSLCLADLDSEDGSYHSSDLPVHHGFDRDELAQQMTSVGLNQARFVDGPTRDHHGRAYSTFVALAARP